MNWWLAAPVFLGVLLSPRVSVAEAPAPPEPERDIGAEARDIFAARCAVCHGSDLAKPKGRFGYVLDLRRVASNPEMVVPSHPDESELWTLISRGEMPPPDSPHGPLSTAEQETVREWIAAGAPTARPQRLASPGATALSEPAPPAPASGSATERAVRWLGKFHLLTLHLPIALVLAAGVGEVVAVWRGSRVPAPAVQFCLVLAALTAVPTAALGWVHAAAGNGVGSPQFLTAHRWLGTIAGVWMIGTALSAGQDGLYGHRTQSTRVALAIEIVLVATVAHLGGLMARGREFFDW